LLDGPALLNLVKFCQIRENMGMPLDMSQFGRIEQPTSSIKGVINGVLKNEVENETNLFVTQATVQ
jgi:hypothetical protein